MQKTRSKSLLVTTTMTKQVYELFKTRAGIGNGLSRQEILAKLYGDKPFFEAYYNWTKRVLPTMNSLRFRTKMFLIWKSVV